MKTAPTSATIRVAIAASFHPITDHKIGTPAAIGNPTVCQVTIRSARAHLLAASALFSVNRKIQFARWVIGTAIAARTLRPQMNMTQTVSTRPDNAERRRAVRIHPSAMKPARADEPIRCQGDAACRQPEEHTLMQLAAAEGRRCESVDRAKCGRFDDMTVRRIDGDARLTRGLVAE